MLVRLDNFVEAGLISVSELRPYIFYWIELISGNKEDWHTPEVFALLLNYMKEYDFSGAAKLVQQFGFNSDPSPALLQKAIAQTIEYRTHTTFHGSADAADAAPGI
jgi:hypothetical protein